MGNRNGDMVLPSGGGGWTFVLAKNFEDVNQLTKYEKNREMNETEVNPHYSCDYLCASTALLTH
ncbi:MAG: hypothetical protein EOM05_06820 [Clostridia bacterium]|nr:hypothetical protein [Clostridia bacterium]